VIVGLGRELDEVHQHHISDPPPDYEERYLQFGQVGKSRTGSVLGEVTETL
jgi:hypothetical protein